MGGGGQRDIASALLHVKHSRAATAARGCSRRAFSIICILKSPKEELGLLFTQVLARGRGSEQNYIVIQALLTSLDVEEGVKINSHLETSQT